VTSESAVPHAGIPLRPPPFGRLITAMVTPFDADGALDLDAAAELATRLVDEQQHDGLVLNGTAGESPTTTDDEKRNLIRVVCQAVGDRASIVAGVGTFSTEHTIKLAHEAADAGAHGVLVVTPYYSKPPQAGLLQHFRTVADSVELPVMLYDIPHRAGIPIATATLLALSEHPRIVAVKDAKGDLVASSQVIATTRAAGHQLDFYCGDDPLTLPMLALGAVGVVGTSTHFTGLTVRAMIDAFLAGDHEAALALHIQGLPLFTGIFATQGSILVKAGLELQGRGVGGLRSPLVAATDAERSALAECMRAAGVPVGS